MFAEINFTNACIVYIRHRVHRPTKMVTERSFFVKLHSERVIDVGAKN